MPPNLSNLHDVFHVSQLRKYISDHSHVIPVQIVDHEVKQLRGKEIALVQVAWGGAADGNLTWELESRMRESYPELF